MHHFFGTYKKIQEKEVEIIGFEGREKAKEAFEKSIKMYIEDKNSQS
jgi:inorganic pyrophosphatase